LGIVIARKIDFVTRSSVGPDILQRHRLLIKVLEVLEVENHS
jgi:hypothetical protein